MSTRPLVAQYAEITPDPLSDERRGRAEALHTAAAVLGANGDRDAVVTDLVDLAAYVMTGRHPLDRYEEGAGQ